LAHGVAGVVDFVASVSTPTASELAQAPDLLSIPLTATAIAPGYYVRSPSMREFGEYKD
jgi:hypothetical protein